MNKFVLASLAALIPAAPVAAADFSGPSIEAHAAWDRVQAKVSYAGESAKGHDTGAAYGVGVGYDFRFQHSVVGVLAAIDDSSVKECASDGTTRTCATVGRDIEVGARFGAFAEPRLLVYLKAAYANTRAGLSYRDSAAPADDFSAHDSRDGIRVGVGMEYAITPHAFVKAEYRYTDYKNLRLDADGDTARIGLSRHQLLGAIGYRF
jgi:outer membrane immunogenic protein